MLLAACLLVCASASSSLPSVAEGRVQLSNGNSLWYRIVRPALLTAQRPPLLVCHGGPQVPSDYLFDLERVGPPDRACIFFDQLGCGRSDLPPAGSDAYSLEASVSDLRTVISSLGLERYHLYGQSWGGLLAFLHLTSPLDAADASSSSSAQAVSLTLSNTPTSVPLVEAEAGRLIADECEGEVSNFMAKHNYRGGPDQPPQLAAAYAHAGTTWRGTAAIAGLEASAEAMAECNLPALVVRGEHDFCTQACVEGWRGLPNVMFETIDGASHHSLLEDPERYLHVLSSFLEAHD